MPQFSFQDFKSLFPWVARAQSVAMRRKWFAQDTEQVLQEVQTQRHGLSSSEAQKRQQQFGFNVLPQKKDVSVFILFLKQLVNPLVGILIVAGVISWYVGHTVDTVVIIIVIAINTVIGLTQELRARSSVNALKKLVHTYAKVYRDGKLTRINAQYLVVGDIVDVVLGDRIPADMRVISSQNFATQEAILTGESEPKTKINDALTKQECVVADQDNMAFMGTSAVRGKARGVVVATGVGSEIGAIASALEESEHPPTDFQKTLGTLSIKILVFSLAMSSLIFGIGVLQGRELADMFLLTLASLVSLIPEGLPAVVSIVLAVGVYRMSKRKAIIKNLPSAETIGSVSVICTDKTGTLTRGEMMVQMLISRNNTVSVTGNGFIPTGEFFANGEKIIPPTNGEIDTLLKSGVLAVDSEIEYKEDAYSIIGDPTEGAVVVAGEKAGIKRAELLEQADDVMTYPFDSRVRYGGNCITRNNRVFFYVAGAPEEILEKSTQVYDGQYHREINEHDKTYFQTQYSNASKKGLRIIGLGFREITDGETHNLQAENLVFLGLCVMVDSPREGVKQSIQTAQQAGVRVIMVTGDHIDTAWEIGKQIGLTHEQDNESTRSKQVLSEAEISHLDAAQLRERLQDAVIIGRVTPKSKLRIVKALQENNEIVAMTGDGVNDAPALQQADIGISMGITGTDAAKQASQMILADDNFASIVNAMEEGRVILRNMRQTIAFLITTSLGEGLIVLMGLVLNLPLILLPLQILFLNLVTGGTNDIALAMEGNHHDTLRDKNMVKNNRIITRDFIPYSIIVAGLMTIGALAVFLYYQDQSIEKARTMAFATLVFFQLWNVFNMRSLRLSLFKLGVFSNKYVIGSLIASVVLMVLIIQSSFGQTLFSIEALSLVEWLIATAIGFSVFVAGELWKLVRQIEFKRERARAR